MTSQLKLFLFSVLNLFILCASYSFNSTTILLSIKPTAMFFNNIALSLISAIIGLKAVMWVTDLFLNEGLNMSLFRFLRLVGLRLMQSIIWSIFRIFIWPVHESYTIVRIYLRRFFVFH